MVESVTNCFGSTEEEVINSPWGFRERFMRNLCCPAISIHIQKPLGVKSRTSWLRSRYCMPLDDSSPGIFPHMRLPIHTYLPYLNQPFALLLSPTFEELKHPSRTIAFKAAFLLCWAVSSRSSEPQRVNYLGINTHMHRSVYMHAYLYVDIYVY